MESGQVSMPARLLKSHFFFTALIVPCVMAHHNAREKLD